eukprot:5352811-Alexandrium_andersonii.AAC.1
MAGLQDAAKNISEGVECLELAYSQLEEKMRKNTEQVVACVQGLQGLTGRVGEQEKRRAPYSDVTRQIDEQMAKFHEAGKGCEEDLRRAQAFSASRSTSAGGSAASVAFSQGPEDSQRGKRA